MKGREIEKGKDDKSLKGKEAADLDESPLGRPF